MHRRQTAIGDGSHRAQLQGTGAIDRGDDPAVALTAYASKDYARSVLLEGFQVHVPKPVESHRSDSGRRQPRRTQRRATVHTIAFLKNRGLVYSPTA
jgi:CheY-like chemotaxis protein